MSEEKRCFSRVPFSVTAEININNVTYNADKINNLSIGGCLFPISEDLEVGSGCIVVIYLSGTSSEAKVQVNGEIVRCDPGMAAIKFTRIDPDSLFHLQNIIRYNALDPNEIEKEICCHPGLV